jgi:hypothetical protein
MFVTRGESEFEVSIGAVDGEWEGKIVEYNLNRVVPIVHPVTTGHPSMPLSLVCGDAGNAFPEELDETG